MAPIHVRKLRLQFELRIGAAACCRLNVSRASARDTFELALVAVAQLDAYVKKNCWGRASPRFRNVLLSISPDGKLCRLFLTM